MKWHWPLRETTQQTTWLMDEAGNYIAPGGYPIGLTRLKQGGEEHWWISLGNRNRALSVEEGHWIYTYPTEFYMEELL